MPAEGGAPSVAAPSAPSTAAGPDAAVGRRDASMRRSVAASGSTKSRTGRAPRPAAMNRCQISAGYVPPVTAIGVAGGTIERLALGKPTHTAVASSGV